MLSVAIQMLSEQYPGKYSIGVAAHHNEIFDNNPHVSFVRPTPPPVVINGVSQKIYRNDQDELCLELDYPLIHQSNNRPVSFLQGYVDDLANKLSLPLTLTTNKPSLYLSESEKASPGFDLPMQYALINAGHKRDFTAKHPGSAIYQEIVDHYKGKIQVVQCGHASDIHPPLAGVINLVGQTSMRQLITLAYHSLFGVCPVTFLHWIYSALQKPCVVYQGGREPLVWEYSCTSKMLNTIGELPCCSNGGCWKNKTVKIDGDTSLCTNPVQYKHETIPLCMKTLGSAAAIRTIDTYLSSGLVRLKEKVMYTDKPKYGLVIGTYGSVGYSALQLEVAKHYYPDVPILIVDDHSPSYRELNRLAKKYGASFISNPTRFGHALGDMSVLYHGLLWAEVNDIEIISKFSRRWLVTADWREGLAVLLSSGHATFSAECRFNNFGFRTECLGMHVDSWLSGGFLQDTHDRLERREMFLPERYVHIHSQRIATGQFANWELMGDSRIVKQPNVLSHWTCTPTDYFNLANAYALTYPLAEFERV